MDFNLSAFCDMLGERIEECKSSSKKRRFERGSVEPRAKIAKLSRQSTIENSTRRAGINMYTSTPVEALKSGPKQLSMLSTVFSSVIKSQSLGATRLNLRKSNINVRKLNFDDTEESSEHVIDATHVKTPKSTEKSYTSPVSFSSVAKMPSRRILSRRSTINNGGKLTFDDEECEDKVEGSSNDFNDVTLSQDRVSSQETPKRCNIEKRIGENFYDVDSFSGNSGKPDQVERSQINRKLLRRPNLKTRILNFDANDDEDVEESSSNISSADSTLTQDSQQTSVLQLSMGISFHPLHYK